MNTQAPLQPRHPLPLSAAHSLLPDLDILVLTYNHGPFLTECLDSILAQNTSYSYRIHILDDHSTDDTSSIAADYAARYPDKIIHHLHTRNVGAIANVFYGYAQAKGSFWCLIEGDDYWSDTSKVQTQLDFLNENPSYVGTAHETLRTSNNTPVSEATRTRYTHEDMALGIVHFHTSSLIWRNIYGGAMPLLHNAPVGDIFAQVLYTQYGDIHNILKPMSMYRIHSQGTFQNIHRVKGYFQTIQSLTIYINLFKGKTRRMLRQRLSRFRISWCLDRIRHAPLQTLPHFFMMILTEFMCTPNGYIVLYNQLFHKRKR
jgi:glycosyltransferase involved in cell wall biosynthesis